MSSLTDDRVSWLKNPRVDNNGHKGLPRRVAPDTKVSDLCPDRGRWNLALKGEGQRRLRTTDKCSVLVVGQVRHGDGELVTRRAWGDRPQLSHLRDLQRLSDAQHNLRAPTNHASESYLCHKLNRSPYRCPCRLGSTNESTSGIPSPSSTKNLGVSSDI